MLLWPCVTVILQCSTNLIPFLNLTSVLYNVQHYSTPICHTFIYWDPKMWQQANHTYCQMYLKYLFSLWSLCKGPLQNFSSAQSWPWWPGYWCCTRPPQTLFPNNILPFSVNWESLDLLSGVYDSNTYKWIIVKEQTEKVSRSLSTEHCMYSQTQTYCCFLPAISRAISAKTGVASKQTRDASYRNTLLLDSPIKEKPDIVLLDTNCSLVTWCTVHAVTKVTSQKFEFNKLVATVTDKSYIILTTQTDCTFIPILSVWGFHKFPELCTKPPAS